MISFLLLALFGVIPCCASRLSIIPARGRADAVSIL